MDGALRAHVGQYTAARPLEFFVEIDYRDPVLMRTHSHHWIELARMQHEPHPSPIRRGALLYNIFDSRSEGFATAMEELMMKAGLCDSRPRSRELVYILLAQRAARALGELRMHANELSLEEAARFASDRTPRGWLRLDGRTVWFEQHLYLQQPGYGTSYLLGKLEIDELLGAGAAAGKRVHPAPGHRRDRRVGADPRFAGAVGAHWRERPCPRRGMAGDTAAKVNASTGDRA